MSRRRLWVIAGCGAVVLIALAFLLHSRGPSAGGEAAGDSASADASGTSDSATPSSAAAAPTQPGSAQLPAQGAPSATAPPEGTVPGPQNQQGALFKTDSSGRLIPDEQARLEIEKLVALNSPAELQQKVQELAQTLPPPAAQQLPDLVDRYRDYTVAQRQAVPPDTAPANEQDALTMLETMHALRVQYFGKEVAEGFFAAEEAKQRQLIELMRLQNDQSLTIQERAEKAQAVYQTMPEFRAPEKK
jgi:hypothetical protein